MGGGGVHRYPVIPNWKWGLKPHNQTTRNVIATVFYFSVAAGAWYWGTKHERLLRPPHHPYPAQKYNAHNLEDDPEYPQKVAEWKEATKDGLLARIRPDKGH
ncbi:hypothetical protein PROFUN_11276 [Planoprotostelium fungivorum]|uniref:Uncharacterized protein n=1 Tax=Planoprotostelium fungivorum TaxID=1890364 RepID=A0A2P6NAH3_9EUKA|nr:hypothetical protein PROFUN_11276 [Planoprotostelium fungivorum]